MEPIFQILNKVLEVLADVGKSDVEVVDFVLDSRGFSKEIREEVSKIIRRATQH